MRSVGTLHPTDNIPVPPDTQQTLLIAGSSGQAYDWPTGSTAGGRIVRFTGLTTAGAQLNFNLNLFTTMAAAPSTVGSSVGTTQGTTGFGHAVLGRDSFQIPGDSTGWSVAALSSGYIMAEFWKIGG